jgi:DNA-directed RNA polymerase subunit beta'
MRTFFGDSQFEDLKSTVLSSYQKVFPVERNGFKLELKKIWVDEASTDPKDFSQQKKFKLAGNTWGAPIFASIVMTDPQGKVIDTMDKVRLSTLPRQTPRGSYIVNGMEYQVSNQLIRKMGAYVNRRTTGDQFKAQFNLDGGKNFQITFDPKTNQYRAEMDQAKKPLYPLLHALGVSDAEMKSAWGDDIFLANKVDPKKHILTFAEKFARFQGDSVEEASKAIRDAAAKSKVDPAVSKITLGKDYDHLHPGLVLDTASRLLHVYQGKAKPDDQENLLFKNVLSAEDMLHDVLSSPKNVDGMRMMMQRHLGRRPHIKDIIDFKKLSAPIEKFFSSDTRTNTPEQYNPVHMINGSYRVSIMGTGGIRDPHMITDEMREVHPSHVGFIDSVHTPEGPKIGATTHLTAGVKKDGRAIRTRVVEAKTGKEVWLTPAELYNHTFAFPDEAVLGKGKPAFKNAVVKGQRQGQLAEFKPHEVEYVLPSAAGMFSLSSNLVPFMQHNQGNRAMMASKMLEQAIPLVEREAPYVRTTGLGGKTFLGTIGEDYVIKAPHDGKITEVNKDYIMVGKTKLPIYHNFPLNQKSFLHHEPTVQVGDQVKSGQILAESNFTKDGTLALGKNMRVAYLPYPGLTFEDGIVITESAAKKLSAQRMEQMNFATEKGVRITDARKFKSYYPNDIKPEHFNALDDHGIVKKGAIVQPGQVVIAGLRYDASRPENMSLKRLNRSMERPWANASVKYNGEFPGVVTDVVNRAGEIQVFVKTTEPARESDKLTGLHGNKGVITKVIPDHEAPRGEDGKPIEIMLNPHGIISRINAGQIYESVAGKIAHKTGKPYLVKNFSGEDTGKVLRDELNRLGIDDKETVEMPDGKKVPGVHIGNPYILRLAKTGKAGFSARTPGQGYDYNKQPSKGGEEGAKNIDPMMLYSMLAYGAKKNLVDAYNKGEQNDEFWHAIETGQNMPAVKPSFAYNKFLSMLKGAGVNTIKNGSEVTLAPMTDADVRKLSNGAIKDPVFLYAKDLKPQRGGFLDPAITGGVRGTKYSHIELYEPLPNPAFEKPIRELAGLTKDQYESIVKGTLHVSKDFQLSDKATPGSKTAGYGIKHLLSQFDPERDLPKYVAKLKASKNEIEVEQLNRKVRYLSALKALNLKPEDAYVRSTVPVIPPEFRPIYTMPNGQMQHAPVNNLYQTVGILNKAHEHEVMKFLPESEKAEIREELYRANRALTGLDAPYNRGKDRPILGFMADLAGEKANSSSPKHGFFLDKVITKKQDLVGRGVITAAPDLDVDQLGVPEKMSWQIFRPFIVREFQNAGISIVDAKKEIEQKSPMAKRMLQAAMGKRTVLMNRAPSLHKFSVMAFKPVMTDSLAVRVPPLVLKGFGGDFDGDAVNIHVPASEEALRESHEMFPSRHLFKPGSGELMLMPSQESAIGLYFMSQHPDGRAAINKILPEQFHIKGILDKAGARALYNHIAKEDPKAYANIVNKLKQTGDMAAYKGGFSVGLEDISVNRHARDVIFKEADRVVADMKKTRKAGPELNASVSGVYSKAAEQSYKALEGDLKKNNNNFYHMITSGARGTSSQLMQLISAPGVMKGSKDEPIPIPVKKSYAEGLGTADYFVSTYGARKGMMDRSLQTSEPGAMNKNIMASTMNNLISVMDCGTHKGIKISTSNGSDLDGRMLSRDQGPFKRNQVVTPQLRAAASKQGMHSLEARSPLSCREPKGTCAHCFGHDEYNRLAEIGQNVGVQMGQAITEPMTQLTMRTFHTGGVAGAGPKASGFKRIEQLFEMPKYLAGSATLSDTSGVVTKIEKSAAGGHVVHVGDKRHTVSPGLGVNVKLGDRVAPGDTLSHGVINPRELVKHKGIEAAQDYLASELQNAYQEQGINIQRKAFETVVRSVGNVTKVIKAPKDTHWLPGDVIPYTEARHYNITRAAHLPVHEALGYHLTETIGHLNPSKPLDEKDINYLKKSGYNTIDAVKEPLIHAPTLEGIERIPMTRKDWMAQMGYRYIKRALTDGAAQGWKTNLEGSHPLPAFAFGATFGKKKEHY